MVDDKADERIYQDIDEVGEEPPEFSIGLLLHSFRTRGFFQTLNDENIGPHSHLIVILGIVFIISILIGVYIFLA